MSLPDGRAVIERAAWAGVRVGCAPDTVLGTGTQTARAAIDGGLIGRPLAASAVMVTPGHERWHPHPDFYYARAAARCSTWGRTTSALIHLLGPVRAVTGTASRLRPERVIGSGPRLGQRIPVQVDTHVSGVLEHIGGILTTITTSFDGVATTAAPIEIHGETSTLAVPDPNGFDGEVRCTGSVTTGGGCSRRPRVTRGRPGARADRPVRADPGRPPRASGDLALHVLETMTACWGRRSRADGSR